MTSSSAVKSAAAKHENLRPLLQPQHFSQNFKAIDENGKLHVEETEDRYVLRAVPVNASDTSPLLEQATSASPLKSSWHFSVMQTTWRKQKQEEERKRLRKTAGPTR